MDIINIAGTRCVSLDRTVPTPQQLLTKAGSPSDLEEDEELKIQLFVPKLYFANCTNNTLCTAKFRQKIRIKFLEEKEKHF